MDEQELKKIRLRKKYANLPQDLFDEEGFDPELTELFLEQVEVATKMGWNVPSRESWEREYKQEIAMRDNRESGNG